MRRRGLATALPISASSSERGRSPIRSLFRGWGGFGTDFLVASDIGESGFSRHRYHCFGRRAKVEAGHRNTGNLLSDGALDRAYHRDLIGRHEAERIAGRCGSTGASEAMAIVLR